MEICKRLQCAEKQGEMLLFCGIAVFVVMPDKCIGKETFMRGKCVLNFVNLDWRLLLIKFFLKIEQKSEYMCNVSKTAMRGEAGQKKIWENFCY